MFTRRGKHYDGKARSGESNPRRQTGAGIRGGKRAAGKSKSPPTSQTRLRTGQNMEQGQHHLSGPGDTSNDSQTRAAAKTRRGILDVWLGTTTGLQFEGVCCEILAGCAFSAQKIGGARDGGRDIIVRHGRNRIVVECKHQSNPVGRPVVQKLHSAVMTENAAGGVVISTGGFSPQAMGHERVGRYTNDPINAIKSIRGGEILLIDKEDLRLMAKAAGIRLHEGIDPSTEDVDTASVEKKFNGLRSHPTSIHDLMTLRVAGSYVDTCWLAKFEIEQSFYKSGRLRHKMRKKGECMCGPDGSILEGKFASAVKKGGDATPKSSSTTAARRNVVEYAKAKFTKAVRYKGGNGATYTMMCKPGAANIHVRFEAVGIKRTSLVIKLLRTTYKWDLPDWGRKIECRICNNASVALKPLLLCNNCGKTAHERSCGGKCHACSKTICDSCARKRRGILNTKRFCPECT